MNEKVIEKIKQAMEIHNEVFSTASNVVGAQNWRMEVLEIAKLLHSQPLTVMNYNEMDSVNIVNASTSKKKGGNNGI